MTVRPITDRFAQGEMDALLRKEGITRDAHLDYSCGLYDEEEELLATGSCFGNTIRCLAVDGSRRGEGLLVQIMSHLMDVQARRGNLHVFLYTKPENLDFFTSLGFSPIVSGENVVFLENRREGFRQYCDSLKTLPGKTVAAVVMNCNPFTLGHRHLLEQAAKENDIVHLFLLSEDRGPIPASVRKNLVQEGIQDLPNVILQETGSYLISSATFPGYFLKDADSALMAQAKLDAEIFGKLAKHLGISRRYVGEEKASRVTAIYNQILAERLPAMGIECRIIPRLETEGKIISASTVRQAIHGDALESVRDMLPESTYRYFASQEGAAVTAAIRREKDVIHH